MQAGYFSKTRIQLELPPSTLSYSFECNLKSEIRNLQSITVLPGVLGGRPLRRTAQVRLGANTLRLLGGTPIFAVSRHQFMKYPG